jgi:hypothetical protein
MTMHPTGTPAPSDAVVGLTDDVERRVARELEFEYQRGVSNALLVGAASLPTFIFGEVARELSGQQELPLLAIFGARVAISLLLAAGGLAIRRSRQAAGLARTLDFAALLVVGVLLGGLDALTHGENPLYYGSVATVAFLHCLYVPSTGWKLQALACCACWAGTLAASLAWTYVEGGPPDSAWWARFSNLQFFVLANVATAVMGAALVYRLRRQEIEARSRGRYHLLRPIGAGGFGEVWLARDELLERPCAIKMLDRRFGAQEEYIGRFELEAKATCRLSSPHTVRVYDYGCTRDQRLYYVMEHLNGRDLSSIVGEAGQLPPQRVVPLMRQAASALTEAHEAGIVHRDIKPENLFVTVDEAGEEQLKVLDFGLAAALGGEGGGASRKERVIGTPEYMPPERAKGERGDPRSDVYALGAVMYHLLTGQVLFDGDSSMAILMRHLREPPRRPSELSPAVPEFLDAIVLKCLEKDPEKRFADMRALRKALQTGEVILLRERPRRVA